MRWLMASVGAAALAGCTGEPFQGGMGGGDTSTLDDLLASHAALAAEVGALPLASAGDILVGTGATYSGTARIDLDTATPSTLAGTATIFADFDRGTVAGNVGEVSGRVDGGMDQPFDGGLSISGGRIGLASPSGFDADLGGTMTGASDVLAVDGTLAGNFRADAGGVAGVSGASGIGTSFTLDGAPVTGTVTVVATR